MRRLINFILKLFKKKNTDIVSETENGLFSEVIEKTQIDMKRFYMGGDRGIHNL
jgi:hypothetical protein